MKLSPTHLRRLETLEASSAGAVPRPEDRLSFGELADLPSLAPEARAQLMQAAQRRTPRQVQALRRPELDLVKAAAPEDAPVTLVVLGELVRGATSGREVRTRMAALLSVRSVDLAVAKQLHALATADH